MKQITLESFNGKTISSVKIEEERVIITFTDGSKMNIDSSEWISVDCDEYTELFRTMQIEAEQRAFEEQEARDEEARKLNPKIV